MTIAWFLCCHHDIACALSFSDRHLGYTDLLLNYVIIFYCVNWCSVVCNFKLYTNDTVVNSATENDWCPK